MNKDKEGLDNSPVDYVVSAAKGVLGIVPFAGSLLAEFASTIVPNQRIDRIGKYATSLEERLANIEKDFVKSQLSNENFSELLEESVRQAARSVSDERRRYIASLISSSLSDDKVNYVESRHLLKVLGELNDIEIILLRSYLVRTIGGDKEFYEKHKDIVKKPKVFLGAPKELLDKAGLYDSYNGHLTQLGLIEPQYNMDSDGQIVKRTGSRSALDAYAYEITLFGKLLLRFIGFKHERL